MYRLTEKRFEKAKEILERFRNQLHKSGRTDPGLLEKELRECWHTGYRELQDIMIQLLKNDRYRFLAAYYMDHSSLVVTRFKAPLARVYGIPHYYSQDREAKKAAFWARIPRELKG